jgi:hypothetical protein
MFSTQIILEGNLHRFTPLRHDNSAKMTLRYASAQVVARVIPSKSRGPQIWMQLVRILIDVNGVVLCERAAPATRPIRDRDRDTAWVEREYTSQGLDEFAQAPRLICTSP